MVLVTFSLITKRLLAAAAVAALLLYWFQRSLVVLMLFNAMAFLVEALFGERAKCVSCGAGLQKEIGDGWR